jgi:MFS family permease
MATTNHQPYAVFRIPDFRFLIAIQYITSIASQMQAVAVGWQVYERTGSAMSLAWIGLAQIAPVLLLFLPAGQWVDHHDRRNLMSVSLVVSAMAAAALAYASFTDASVGWIYLACAAGSAAQTLSRPARSAMLPNIVPMAALGNAVTWSSGAFQFASIVGPALAGLFISASGQALTVYEINFALITIALLLSSRISAQPPSGSSQRTLKHLFGGIVHVWNTQVILAVISMDLLAVLFGGATALLPVYAKDILMVGPIGLGWLTAAPAVGAVGMALIMGHLPPSQNAGRTFLLAVAGFGAATVVFGWSTNYWLSLLALAAIGALDNISVITRQTIVQIYTPDEVRGRVSSVNNVFISSSNELGAFESGSVAALTNPVFAVVSGGFATVLLVMVGAKVFPDLRRLRSLTERQDTAK